MQLRSRKRELVRVKYYGKNRVQVDATGMALNRADTGLIRFSGKCHMR